jgi:hypothetical protein
MESSKCFQHIHFIPTTHESRQCFSSLHLSSAIQPYVRVKEPKVGKRLRNIDLKKIKTYKSMSQACGRIFPYAIRLAVELFPSDGLRIVLISKAISKEPQTLLHCAHFL